MIFVAIREAGRYNKIMNIMILGAPGTGKSTVGKALARDYKYSWISTGEILRQSEEEWVKNKLKTGQLFDDDMVMGLAIPRVKQAENAIFDGFPRTLKQAEILIANGIRIDLILEVDVPIEEIQARLSLRGREQDTPEIIEERVMYYHQTKSEILAYLIGHGSKFVVVDGVGTPDEVYARVREAISQ